MEIEGDHMPIDATLKLELPVPRFSGTENYGTADDNANHRTLEEMVVDHITSARLKLRHRNPMLYLGIGWVKHQDGFEIVWNVSNLEVIQCELTERHSLTFEMFPFLHSLKGTVHCCDSWWNWWSWRLLCRVKCGLMGYFMLHMAWSGWLMSTEKSCWAWIWSQWCSSWCLCLCAAGLDFCT